MNSSEFKEWFHYNVKCPHYEGLARVKRAWSGVNVHSIYRPSISLKNRVIALLTGLFLLLIPLFNLLVWKGWETFGHPEVLAPPYAPGNDAVKPKVEPTPVFQEPVEIVALPEPLAPAPVAEAPPFLIENFEYSETTGEETIQATWKLEHHSNHTQITRDSPKDHSEAAYDKHWNLYKLSYREKHTDPLKEEDPDLLGYAHATLKGRILHVEGKKGGKGEVVQKKEFLLEDDHPWIQQPTWGFKAFAKKASANEIEFHAINPKDFTLIRCSAKKRGMENKLLKITASPHWLSLVVKGTMLFDKEGVIHQMNSRFFTTTTVTKLVQNSP